MKALFILLLLITNGLLAQENPWKNKSEENPWGNTPETATDKDSMATVKKTETISTLSKSELLKEAKFEAKNNYKSRQAFGVGFASGIILNVYGFIPDIVYTAIDTDKEREVRDKLEEDPTYKNVPKHELKKTTKNGIKSKKLLASLGGTLLGSVTQLGIIIVLILTL